MAGKPSREGADSENGLIDSIAGNIPGVANGKTTVAIGDPGSGGRVTWELRRDAVDVAVGRSGRHEPAEDPLVSR